VGLKQSFHESAYRLLRQPSPFWGNSAF
jgi:hypothetical protein